MRMSREKAIRELTYWGSYIKIHPYSLDGGSWDDPFQGNTSSVFGRLSALGSERAGPANFSALNDPKVKKVRRVWVFMDPIEQQACALHFSGYISKFGHAELMHIGQAEYDRILNNAIDFYIQWELTLSGAYGKKNKGKTTRKH